MASNIGVFFNTANDYVQAQEWFETAISHYMLVPARVPEWTEGPPILLMNKARCFVHMNVFAAARKLLDICFPELAKDESSSALLS